LDVVGGHRQVHGGQQAGAEADHAAPDGGDHGYRQPPDPLDRLVAVAQVGGDRFPGGRAEAGERGRVPPGAEVLSGHVEPDDRARPVGGGGLQRADEFGERGPGDAVPAPGVVEAHAGDPTVVFAGEGDGRA
jgi:hypothetical protein